MKKTCSHCKRSLSLDCFHKQRSNKDGLRSHCKKCRKQYHQNNKEKITKQRKKSYQENRKERLERQKEWYQKNRKESCKRVKQYKQNNKEKRNKQQRQKYKEDSKFKLDINMKNSINQSLKSQNISKNGRPWESIVNFTLDELMTHLESLFRNGMTWENQGKWHIDHIKPISLFGFESVEDSEFKECWSLNNLQPLWAKENISKGNKYRTLKKHFSHRPRIELEIAEINV